MKNYKTNPNNKNRVYAVYAGKRGVGIKTLFVSSSRESCENFIKNSKICQEAEICDIANYAEPWLAPEYRQMIREGKTLNYEEVNGIETELILNAFNRGL